MADCAAMVCLWPVVSFDVVHLFPCHAPNDGCFEVGVEHEVVEVMPWDPGKSVALGVEEIHLLDGEKEITCGVATLTVVFIFGRDLHVGWAAVPVGQAW